MVKTEKTTKLALAVRAYEKKQKSQFRPTSEFYLELGMSSIRYGKLLKGTAVITGPEAVTLAKFFNIPVTDLI